MGSVVSYAGASVFGAGDIGLASRLLALLQTASSRWLALGAGAVKVAQRRRG